MNNIIREKLDLFSDILHTLNITIDETYLGKNTNNDSYVPYSDEDKTKHFDWCWLKTIDSFKKEHVMLTEDENIINAGFEIQYRKSNPQDFLFNDANPILTLNQLTESAIRDIIGHSKLDEILTIGKQEITSKIQKLIEQSLTVYNLGLELKDVNLSFALPPVAVQQAFNDVIKAREDEQAYQNEAERYKESQLPVALGHAQRILFEADSYKKEKILKAQAHAQTFKLLEKEYKKEPRLMKMRLYYETIDQVMSTTTKILVDPDLSHQLIYLNQPYADNLIEEKKATSAPQSPEAHVKINQTHSWPIRLDSPLIASKD
jgi:membrane protease subunit HflK